MAIAKFVQRAEAVDFRPERDMASGEIVRLGKLIGVTKLSIKKGELGTLALSGVFDVIKPGNVQFPIGSNVYWDTAAAAVSPASGVLLGVAVGDASLADDAVRIIINYSNTAAASSGDEEYQWQTL